MKRTVVDEGVARLEQEYTSGQISYTEYRRALTALFRERMAMRVQHRRDAKVMISREPWPRAKARLFDEGPER